MTNLNKFYNKYHESKKIQKRVIKDNNFTYRNSIFVLKRYSRYSHTVLDLGSGVGTLDFYLAVRGKKIVGVEISKNAVELARENAAFLGLSESVKFIRTNIASFVSKRKFDLIICFEVLEHLQNDKKVLERTRKLLKNSGILVISVPSKNAPFYKLGFLRKFDKDVGHLRRYTLEELKKLAKGVELKVIYTDKTEGILRNFLFTNSYAGKLIRFIKGPISDFVTFIDNLTIPVFGESQIFIVAKKA